MGLKQSPCVLMTFLSLLISLAEPGNGDLCSDLRHVSLLVKFLTNQIYTQHHLNIVHDLTTGALPCLDQLFLVTNWDEDKDDEEVRTVSIGNPRVNSSVPAHRFLSWSWVQFLLVDGRVEERDFRELTSEVQSRAVKSFFTDFILIWQLAHFNPDLLQSPFLDKLKFKAEVIAGGSDPDLDIYSLCFYCNRGEPVRKLVTRIRVGNGTWDNVGSEAIFPDFTQSFHGRVLRVTGGVGIPLLMTFKEIDGVWRPWSGFLIQPILFHLQNKMNFSMSTKVFRTFGSLVNGSFTGFVNELFHERADIGMAGQSYDRIQAVHFLAPIHIDSVSFATAVPDSGVKWHAVFRAFTWDSWVLLLVLCFLVVLPIYYWLGKWAHWMNSTKSATWSDGIGFIYRPIIEQDLTPDLIPSLDSGRVFMVFWLCLVLVLSNIYRSKLTALMVFPDQEEVPNNFENLANSKYKIILHHVGGALYTNIQSTTSSTFQRIAKRLTLENSMYKCLRRAEKQKKTACISYIHNIIGEIHRNFTNWNGVSTLRMAQTGVFMTAGSYMLPKSAVYKESMNSVVAQQIAFGFSKYGLDKAFQAPLDEGKSWAREVQGTGGGDQEGPKSLRMGHMVASFLLLFAGIGIGTGAFCREKYKEARGRKVKVELISGGGTKGATLVPSESVPSVRDGKKIFQKQPENDLMIK